MTASTKNTRRAAMDAEHFDWRCFRFVDDGRKWKPIAKERRAYFVKAANSANQDGTRVEISVRTFMKAGGERATAFRRLHELAEMGACLPELHIDERGYVRELLSPRGAKVRRLLYESLQAAQYLLDVDQEFLGHVHLSDAEQLAIQRGWLCDGTQKWCEEVSDSCAKESQIVGEGVSDSNHEVSNSREGVSDLCQGVSRIGETQPRILTEDSKTERERPIAEPTPSRAPSDFSDTESKAKPGGQGKRTVDPVDIKADKATAPPVVNQDDVDAIGAEFCRLTYKHGAKYRDPKDGVSSGWSKPVPREDIEKMLRRCTRYEILSALQNTFAGAADDQAIKYIEKNFFAKQGGVALVIRQRQQNWLEEIQKFIDAADLDDLPCTDLDEFLRDPVPVGVDMSCDLVNAAQKNWNRLEAAKYPACEGCNKRGHVLVDGACEDCRRR